jgi:DNA-binding response OmpR family regulator
MTNLIDVEGTSIIARPRILITEDDVTQKALWKQILVQACPDALVYWADSYRLAANTLDEHENNKTPFDLLISDIFLAGDENGFDLCRDYFNALKGRIILVSKFGDVQTPTHANTLSKFEPYYLRKPLNISQSIFTVRHLLKQI